MKMYTKIRITCFAFLCLTSLVSSGCDDKEEDKISNDAIISLFVMDQNDLPLTEVAGDGQTLIKLRAVIPRNAADKFRKVTFRASKGQFVASTNNTTYEKKVNADGIVEVFLKIPLDHGKLSLSAEIGADSQKYFSERDVMMIDVGQVITIEALDVIANPLSGAIRADGNTVLTIKATVNFNPDAIGFIKFQNSAGNFLGIGNESNVVTVSQGLAIIQYKVPRNVGQVYIRAESSTNSSLGQNLTLTLSRANPDAIVLEPSALSVDSADDQVSINTFLTRDIGHVSIGSTVEYVAKQMSDNNIEVVVGRFIGLASAYSDDTGQITSVKFLSDTGDVDFDKPIAITVSTFDDGNHPVVASFLLNN
jgi:hypothetical protein